jgi:CRISPR-associated endonuclease Csn1
MSDYILGLDLGVQSIGWAIINCDKKGKTTAVECLGVRCFDSGTGTEAEIEQGKDESHNLKRRTARSVRRNQWRRKRRTLKIFNILRNAGLLPMGHGIGDTPQQRQEMINKLDVQLANEFSLNKDRVAAQLLPYKLRAMALDQNMLLIALGRALFHLSQRRGFLSNKKSQSKEEVEGQVKSGISDLEKQIAEKGSRTLGEYFASLDPEEQRIRQRWTGRQMFRNEFDAIWTAQAKYHAVLTEELRKKIHDAMFFQRPLKSQKHLIGKCNLERDKRRAPLASLEAQRFRYWQKILDIEYRNEKGMMVPLTGEQQDLLAEELEKVEKLTYIQIRKILNFKRPKQSKEEKKISKPIYEFNFETDEEDNSKGIKGNITASRIREIIPQRWDAMPEEEQELLINTILQFELEDALARRLTKVFKFDSNIATQLSAIQLERDHAKLSRQAIQKVLPVMRKKRIRFMAARKEVYGEQFDEERKDVLDFLPPVLQSVKDLKNPIVIRTLTEVRKVVNAIIRKYGKPTTIRVELARDMKKSRAEREEYSKNIRQQEKRRENALALILKETKTREPRPVEILKVLLAEECNWTCPYTGKTITIDNLLGPNPQFDIEHILPFSRSLDNSFANKTLCDIYENRHVKKNQTSWEAYQSDPQHWHEIIARVQNFRGPAAENKLRKFQLEKIPDDFTSRMLNDTRYISRLAGDYLALLFGGRFDSEGTQRIQVSSGGMTAWLRDDWNMNSILKDGGDAKNRNNHRHHAVDAAVIACNDQGMVQKLSEAAEIASEQGIRKLFAKGELKPTLPNFLEQVDKAVNKINISFRVNRKVSGGLHEETNYSPPQLTNDAKGKPVEYRHVRKSLQNMSLSEIENIVDPNIRKLVQSKLESLGNNPKALTENELPYIKTRTGRIIPIRKARIRKTVGTLTLAPKSAKERHVAPGNNHHMEIVAVLDEAGNETKWEGVIVTMFEAYQRKRRKQPIIQREHGQGKRFKFSLALKEYFLMKDQNGVEQLYVVRVISQDKKGVKSVSSKLHTDARPSAEILKSKGLIHNVNTLMEKGIRKVVVDVLGNIHQAND